MTIFNLNFSNIPIANLRVEFDYYIALISNEDFKNNLYECYINPLAIPNLVWNGVPDDLITLMLQRSILGLEAYLGAAVEYELFKRNKLTDEITEKLKNPFKLGGRGTAEIFYEKMPELVDESLKLSISNSQLFSSVKAFYKEIRNPIFHGEQIRASKSEHQILVEVFELIHSVYHWIDSWYTAFPGGWESRPNKQLNKDNFFNAQKPAH